MKEFGFFHNVTGFTTIKTKVVFQDLSNQSFLKEIEFVTIPYSNSIMNLMIKSSAIHFYVIFGIPTTLF